MEKTTLAHKSEAKKSNWQPPTHSHVRRYSSQSSCSGCGACRKVARSTNASASLMLKSLDPGKKVCATRFLQRTYGNQYVQRLIQTKLSVGRPGDVYEQEADRVADTVMRMPEPQIQRQPIEEEEEELQMKSLSDQITPLVQRQPEEEEEEEEIQMQAKPVAGQITPLVQKQPMEEEEEELQVKEAPDRTPDVTPDLETNLNALRGGGQPLPESVRASFEPRFGYDFNQVRVHTDTLAAKTTRAVNARAFTVGRDIVFGSGQYQPATTAGKKLMAHELTHVVQQGAGKAGTQGKSGSPKLQLNLTTGNQVIQRLLSLSYGNYRGRCECGENLGNNCAHYLSDALIRTGYSDLDGGRGALYRRRNGRIVCKSGRPVRAKELRDWFASKATDTLRNEPENSIPSGFWAVYQERARDGQGHVVIHSHSGTAYTWRGTGDYPTWRTQIHYRIPSVPGDWNLPSGDTRLA